MGIITEGMKYRKKICDYAVKSGNMSKAARRYHKSRQYVSYWMKRYDGTIESLRKKSTKPNSHPNEHTQEELDIIKHMHRHHRYRGLAHVYRKCKDKGYIRTYDSMCRQIRKLELEKPKAKPPKKKKREKKEEKPKKIGEMVQVDVKYVPISCIGFQSNHPRYYQITAIDVCSRKRVLEITNEISTYNTSSFVEKLEEKMGFKIHGIQTDNGREFTNEAGEKESRFEKTLKKLGIDYKKTAPYSPWQNGYVERSHREDEKFYQNKRFKSEEELKKSVKRHETYYNGNYRKVLGFKSANEVVKEHLQNAS